MAKQDDTRPCVHVGCKGTMTYHQKLLVGQGASSLYNRATWSVPVQIRTTRDGSVTLIGAMLLGINPRPLLGL